MLSIGSDVVVECQHVFFDSSTSEVTSVEPLGTAAPTGYTPDEIRAAYGIDSIVLDGITGDGAGQTIAIIDAYDNPNFVSSTDSDFATSDLAMFDDYFGIEDPPSFTKLDQDGGTDYPEADAGWASEIALDVEWAHAIAPQADIVLIEANSESLSDIWAAVDTARNLPGVTVISMSLGCDEFAGETAYDSWLTTPAGHTGITFVAASGDSGSPALYPACSSNVVAVGGTTLTLNGTTYVTETAWSGSGGGQSLYETEPDYQTGMQTSGDRQTPDVAFVAAPATGVAVYDSFNQGTANPWATIGGTSLSAPCWAGLIAIANQLRDSQGLASLDGESETLPALYSLSVTAFHDVTSGSNGDYTADSGYDMVTGRGSSVANTLIPALASWGIDSTPQVTVVDASDVTSFGDTRYTFTVTYTDDVAIDVSTLDGADMRVTGPNGFDQLATFVSASAASDGSPRVATYQITPPGGSWDTDDKGTYSIALESDQVTDTAGNAVPAGTLETFVATGGILFVDRDATGSNKGTSWTDAFTNLQDALSAATAGDQIWVAAGTYKPTSDANRSKSFVLLTGVAIYGGFAGTETRLDQRDWTENVTTLSGDIGIASLASDNSYHVVYASGVTDATLDGFTITGGNASGSVGATNGGGMLCADNSSPTVANCIFSRNSARYAGAGMSVENSSPTITDCTFRRNSVTIGGTGGGMYNYASAPTITNVVFSNNSASGYEGGGIFNSFSSPTLTNVVFSGNLALDGGALYNLSSSPELVNVTFTSNTATGSGGAMASSADSQPTLLNCIVWGNAAATSSEISDDADSETTVSYSIVEGGWSGTGNLASDPLLDSDWQLKAKSPAIDAGSTIGAPNDDLDGLSRPQDGDGDGTADCDMGAYEYAGAPVVTAVSISESLLSDDCVGSGALLITITYNEAMDVASAPTIAFDTSVTGTLIFTGGRWSANGLNYTATYDVFDANVETSGIGITVTGARDTSLAKQTAYAEGSLLDIDTKNPAVAALSLSDTRLTDGDLGTQFVVSVTYSETMNTSISPTIAFTPSLTGSLSPVSGTWLDSTHFKQTYRLVDDNIVVSSVGISVAGTFDTNGNLQDAFSAGDQFSIDTKTLCVESIVRAGAATTNADTVEFVVTFSAVAYDVDSTDFEVTGMSGAAVTTVTGTGMVYRVAVATGTGTGTLELDLIDDDSIHGALLNPLGGIGVGNGNFTAGETYTIDRTPPTVVAFDLLDENPTTATTLQFTITFSEAVSGVCAASFAIVAPNLGSADVTDVTGSGASYVVTVDRGPGSGTLQLDLLDDDTITDALGNALGGTGEGNGYTAGPRYTIQSVASTIGLFAPKTATFYLNLDNTSGGADVTFAFGSAGSDYEVLVGDWDGDGTTGVGLYAPETSTFYLTNASTSGYAEITFGFGAAGEGWTPLVGDWNGDGDDSVGLYNPKTSTFYLSDTLKTGFAEYTFGYGEAGGGWTPLVGDWNGDGSTGVGLYAPQSSLFFLTDTLASGFAEHTFGYGEPNAGWQPLVGDWDGDGASDVGLYAPQTSCFYLTTAFVTGYAQYTFGYGQPGAGWTPLVGDWDGDGASGVGLYNPTASTYYLTDTLTSGYAEYTIAFGKPGAGWQPLVGSWSTAESTSIASAVDQSDSASVTEQPTDQDLALLSMSHAAVDLALQSF